MSKRLMVAIIVLIFAGASRGEEPFAKMSFKEACAAAKRDSKVVLIDFYTTWCGPCKRMDKTTWKDKKVIAWMKEKTVALKVDAEEDVELAKKYTIEGYPTIVFIKPDGTEIDRLVGGRDADGFLEDANAALSGKDGIARAKEKLKGGENDPMMRKQYAQSLEQKGKYDEALDEYLWCFDHGASSAGFGGVRLSFLLSDIHRLSAKLPRARQELEKRRDKAEAKVFAKSGGDSPFDPVRMNSLMEYNAINRTLGDLEKSLTLYDKVIAEEEPNPVFIRILLRDISELLVKKQRYADLLKGTGNAKDFVEQEISQFSMMTKALSKSKHADTMKDAAASLRKGVVDGCTPVYESLVGTGQHKQAEWVSNKLIEFDGSAETYIALMKRAVRAGNNELARKLAASAAKSLEGENAERVAHAAKDIPTE
ncbi:Thioredoxin [Phycisphaerae bacterium RAS2]|nr:Thioredoxin [Phycisphaerae bacterium RAS2]